MSKRANDNTGKALFVLLLLSLWVTTGCNTTKNLKDGQYLLRQNSIKLKYQQNITRKGELKDNIQKVIDQKPNHYFLGMFPVKLWLYNMNPKKYEKDTINFQLKSNTVERPIIFDSSLMRRSAQNIKSYLYNQGYFYAQVKDTVKFKKKKAYITYDIKTGFSYLINKVDFSSGVADSAIKQFIDDTKDESFLQKGSDFSFSLFESERSRITSVLRDKGYFKFSQENILFELDTANKALLRGADNPFESAINFIALQKNAKRPTTDIKVIISKEDEPDAYKRYVISKVEMYPDYKSRSDLRDSTMIRKEYGRIAFKYHDYYVHEKVLQKHIYLTPGKYYSQTDYDNTITKLNELGIFQFLRVSFREDTSLGNRFLICRIEANKNQKHTLATNYEVSNGTNYLFGTSLTETFRDINVAKGANLLTITANGGIELPPDTGNHYFKNLFIQTKYYGLNASLDFPKFIAPISASKFSTTNLPHTIISIGTNLIDRVDYFTLVNDNLNFKYNWRETPTKTWDFSPAFINIIRLPKESDSFKARLDQNEFLRNSYKENFIEGENLSFTFSNQERKHGQNYSYLSAGVEEAGALLSAVNGVGASLNDLFRIKYAQYTKFDLDAKHYFSRPHSTFVLRFNAGVGLPYGQSSALPYIKQYYAGGPYSLRGWRIRSLGPGSSNDSSVLNNSIYIDRTGDIKLEFNSEFRFDIVQLFAGFIKLNGAFFADAGNIWLARKDPGFPGGEFKFSTLGQDVATDVGAGARFDIASFITLRFDLAFPIKKPYVFENSGWVVNQINFGDPTWRSNNLVLNIAIGYPF